MNPKTIQDLIDLFSRLPGIGPRHATRIAFHLINAKKTDNAKLASAITSLAEKIKICPVCLASYETQKDGQKTCVLCANPKRLKTSLCVVERETDIDTIEKTGIFKGVYQVLGEQSDILDKTMPAPIAHLLERIVFIQKQLPEQKKKEMEIIIATNATVQGDALAAYLEKNIMPLGATITRLGRGLASGSELEYADTQTLQAAFENRKPSS